MICRITLNLRTTIYGPAQVNERTRNHVPLSILEPRAPRNAYFNSYNLRRNRLAKTAFNNSTSRDEVRIDVNIETELDSAVDSHNDSFQSDGKNFRGTRLVNHDDSQGFLTPETMNPLAGTISGPGEALVTNLR
jgi:hypothetical protein